jgi:hypothetical protein
LSQPAGSSFFSGTSGLNPDGSFALDAGIRSTGQVSFNPSYLRNSRRLDAGLTDSPFVMYGVGQAIIATGAEVLAEVGPSCFNRSNAHFSSHQHAPDDPAAAALGAGATLKGGIGYIAYPIFAMYHAMGQPLYKYAVRGLIDLLLPSRAIVTDLPSSARATLTRQDEQKRHVLHLLYGAPQIRGKAVPSGEGTRVMEMIEDIPTLGPVTASVRLPRSPSRVYDALTGEDAQPVQKIAETIASITASRLSERGISHEPHTITLNCDIILRGSTRRPPAPNNSGSR